MAGRRCASAVERVRLASDQAPSQAISSAAKTGPSRQTRCGVPVDAHDDAAEARPDRAAHVLLHRHLEERLAAGRRRADRVGLAAAALAPELGDAEPLAPAGGEPGEGGEHRLRAAGERLVGPGLVLGHELGHEAVVAERAVVGRDDVLDLVGQQARRVDLARRSRPRTAA